MQDSFEYRRIIVPVTGNIEDRKTLELARELGSSHDVTIILVFVVEVPQALPLDADLPNEIHQGEVVLANAELTATKLMNNSGTSVSTDLLQARSAGSAIVDEAIEQGADAILMAARVRVVHGRPTTGDTVSYVMVNAPCDVLIVRAAPSFIAGGH